MEYNFDKIEWFAGSGRKLYLTISRDDAYNCSRYGDMTMPVEELSFRVEDQTAKWDAEVLRDELREYGAWDDTEPQDHQENTQRMIWIACNDVNEDPCFYAEAEE